MIDPEFWSPRQNPWGMVIGAVLPALAGLLVKRVRLWIVRKWRSMWANNTLIEQGRVLQAMVAATQAQLTYLTDEHKALKDVVDDLVHEAKPNGGGSWRDESRKQFTTLLGLLTLTDTGQFILRANGAFEWANPVFLRWTGHSPAQLEGRGMYGIVEAADLYRFREDLEAAIEGGYEFRGQYVIRMFDHTGTAYAKVMTDWICTPQRDPATDKIVAWVGNVRRSVPEARVVLRDHQLTADED